MKPYFEYSDKLNKPYEAFLFDAQTSEMFPILPHWHYFVEILYMVEGKAYVEARELCIGTGRSDRILSADDSCNLFSRTTSNPLLCPEI